MGCVCLWRKIKKGGREAEKEGDIREIGKKCLERKRKCNILNIYLINHNCTGITTNMSATSNNTVGHKCTACQLCQKLNSKMKHPNQMKVQPQFSEVYVWLKKHKPIINDSACLCLPCVKQIQRNHSKEFTPRWLPKPPVPPILCNIEHCMHTVYAQTTLINTDELESCLKCTSQCIYCYLWPVYLHWAV